MAIHYNFVIFCSHLGALGQGFVHKSMEKTAIFPWFSPRAPGLGEPLKPGDFPGKQQLTEPPVERYNISINQPGFAGAFW